ncbi:MAG TPA: glycosyl transferase family 36 [Chloroflexota bacterium]|nr:glycosyl transferase family 36 [Chloroflexota bacterium]
MVQQVAEKPPLIETDYGHFSEDGLEYIITRPDIPRPWVNYLSNEEYCALISQTGGGYSFIHGSGYDRIQRWFPGEAVLQDRPGRYVYIRDDDTGEYWSVNWQPCLKPFQSWECHHGLGYSWIKSRAQDIESELLYFVPQDENVEFWVVTLRNRSDRRRKLSIYPYSEWTLSSYGPDLTERSFHVLFNEVEQKDGIIYASKRYWPTVSMVVGQTPNIEWNKYVFMTTSMPFRGFDCVRRNFIGDYRDWQAPVALERGSCTNSQGAGYDSIGAFQHVVEMEPGQEIQFHVTIGAVPKDQRQDAVRIKEKYSDTARVMDAFGGLRRFWADYVSKLTVSTPDPEFDLSVNVWNKYQTWITAHWARMASYYIGGGSIMGFRDLSQDILGVLPCDLEMAKKRTISIISHQFANGSTIHNWDPLTNTGAVTGHCDDPLWLVMCVLNYFKETGDTAFLSESVPYLDAGAGTVREHMVRGLFYALKQRSPRGLSLIQSGDWNDGLNFVGVLGRGESIMNSHFLAWMLKEVAELFDFLGDNRARDRVTIEYNRTRDAINRYAWDGEWYWRASKDNGELLGSRTNAEGSIYLNSQSWAVLGGVAEGERGIRCMNSVRERLDTPYGPALFLPAYQQPDHTIGIITRFAPGTKENGTIFCHPVAWAVIAECMLGRGDMAYHYWKETSFLTRGKDPDLYKADPYVYAEYIYGPDHPNFGEGEFSWTTGTAAWMWRACTDWILGVRPIARGLIVDPCLPSDWDRAEMVRNFRGATYEFHIDNRNHVSRGVDQVRVDGKEIRGNLLPEFRDGGRHVVEVRMGRR